MDISIKSSHCIHCEKASSYIFEPSLTDCPFYFIARNPSCSQCSFYYCLECGGLSENMSSFSKERICMFSENRKRKQLLLWPFLV